MLPNTLRGGRQRSSSIQVMAPTKGIDSTTSLAKMDPETCVYTYNLLAEDFGCEVRDGYIEWANGWAGGSARTIIPFTGNVPADDKLYVASLDGIYDVTEEGDTAPLRVLEWPDKSNSAGICSYINYANDNSDRFILLCDEQNGYYIYTQTTDTWAQGTITGPGPPSEDYVYITIWKTRVWLIERDSANAWYLPPGDLAGTAVPFAWGRQFRFGGQLRSIHNWTLDGGAGMDDYLVGISSAGDIIVYQGTDPASQNDFSLVGSWYIGALPAGRRIATEFSGELYIVSVYGLVAMSQILNGAGPENPTTYLTKRIAPYIRGVLDDTITQFGWHIHIHPKQSLLFINSPARPGRETLAFTAYLGTDAWSMVRGLDKADTANWRGEVFWADATTNKIHRQAGYVDGVYLDPSIDGDPQAIEWDMLTAYMDLGNDVAYKRTQYIRPMFVANGVPGFNVEARYDFDLTEISGSPVLSSESAGLWSNAGEGVYELAADENDLLYLQLGAGADKITGAETVDITIDARPLTTLTWSAPNERYEVTDAGVYAYLTGIPALQNVIFVITPDTYPSDNYTMLVSASPFGDNNAYGYSTPTFDPAYTAYGSLTPSIIAGTGIVTANPSLWDIGRWGGGIQASDNPRGANGLGRHVAIAIRGRSSEPTTLVSFDVTLDSGGFM